MTCGYTLQRWMNACAGRGNYPIKFNGTIFTVDGCGRLDKLKVTPEPRKKDVVVLPLQ